MSIGKVYAILRDVLHDHEEPMNQYIASYRSMETLQHTIIRTKEIVQMKISSRVTKIDIKLDIIEGDQELLLEGAVVFEDLKLEPFLAKTVIIKVESEDKKVEAFSVWSMFFFPTQGSPSEDHQFILLNLDFLNINGLEIYAAYCAEQLSKKRLTAGFSDYEFEIIFEYGQQFYNAIFTYDEARRKNVQFRQNTFVADKKNILPLNIKVFCYEYTWLLDRGQRTLKQKKQIDGISVDSVDLSALGNSDQIIKTNKFGDLYMEYVLWVTTSNFIENFVGTMKLRLMETTFIQEFVESPVAKVTQLGKGACYYLEPFKTGRADTVFSYIWDADLAKTSSETENSEAKQDATESEQFVQQCYSIIDKGKFQKGFEEADVENDPSLAAAVNHLMQKEEKEIESNKGDDSLDMKQNNCIFQITVPNEVLLIEIYRKGKAARENFVGYCFIPMVSVSLSNIMEEQILCFPSLNVNMVVGSIQMKFDYSPSNFKISSEIVNNLTSLDVDDVLEQFKAPDKYSLVIEQMSQNVVNTENWLWSRFLKNSLADMKTPKKVMLTLNNIGNALAFGLSSIKGTDVTLKSNQFFHIISCVHNGIFYIVQVGQDQNILLFRVRTMNFSDLKTRYPKQYFQITNDLFTQVTSNTDQAFEVIFRNSDKSFTVMTAEKYELYPQFLWTLSSPFEDAIISLHDKDKMIDFKVVSFTSLPIQENSDKFIVPLKIPGARPQDEKITIFFEFAILIDDIQEEKESTSHIALVSLYRVRQKPWSLRFDMLAGKDYEFIVEGPDENESKTKVSLLQDSFIERSTLESLATFRVSDKTSVSFGFKVFKIFTAEATEMNKPRGKIFENKIGADFSESMLWTKKLKIEDTFKKEEKFVFEAQLFAEYNHNIFIQNPTGSISIRFNDSIMKFLQTNFYITSLHAIEFFLVNKQSQKTQIMPVSQAALENSGVLQFSCFDFMDSIVVSALDENQGVVDQTIIKIRELKFTEPEIEIIEYIFLADVRIPLILSYAPLASESEGGSQKGGVASQRAGDSASKGQGTAEFKGLASKEILDDLKIQIKNIEDENAKLITNINRKQAHFERRNKVLEQLKAYAAKDEELKGIRKEPFVKTSKPASTGISMSNPGLTTSGDAATKTANVNKAKELFNSICSCGNPAPKFKGYCADCLKKLKEQYDKELKAFAPIAEEYDNIISKKDILSKKRAALQRKIALIDQKTKNLEFDFVEDDDDKATKEQMRVTRNDILLKKHELEVLQQEFDFEAQKKKAEQKKLEETLLKKAKKLEILQNQIETMGIDDEQHANL